jgi:protein-disulfide isomerase
MNVLLGEFKGYSENDTYSWDHRIHIAATRNPYIITHNDEEGEHMDEEKGIRRTRTKHKRHVSHDSEQKSSPAINPAIIGVYVILGLLVVGASFYTGYLTGQNQQLKEAVRGQVAAPSPSQPSAPAPSAPQPQAAPTVKADVAEGRYVTGDKNAPVTIVEFSDYQCPFCKRFYDQTEQQLIDTYVKTGKVKYSVRHFPLGFHQNAQKSAEAAECAGQQGKFWEMHKVLFQYSQADGTGLNVPDLKKYAADLKLDTAKFNSCLDNGETASIVQKDMSDGQAAGVSGTPSFYVNGKQLVGAQPFNMFQETIDAELAG